MERIRKLVYREIEILRIDYSNCKEQEMIDLISQSAELVQSENKKTFVLSIMNRQNFITPHFMNHVEKVLKSTDHLVSKNAVVGLSEIQTWILKGINLWYKVKLNHFKTEEKALEFLAEESK